MGGGIEKPKPLKVFGRTHYACTRCKLSKIRCSGEKPACTNCKNVNKEDACVYPNRDRKIVIMESDLNKLHDRVGYLESLVRNNNHPLTQTMSSSSPNANHNIPKPVKLKASHSPGSFLPPFPNHSAVTPSHPSYNHSTPSSSSIHVPNDNSFIQNHIIDKNYILDESTIVPHLPDESYLLPDIENGALQLKILNLCAHRLPDKEYTLCLINKVYNTYSSEFYLIGLDHISNLVADVYSIVDQCKLDSNDQSCVSMLAGKIPATSLCYLFIIIAFGEQLLNVSSTSPSTPSPLASLSTGSSPDVTTFASSNNHRKQKIPGIDYYLLAAQLFRLTQEEITIEFIQSALLLALYSANLNRYNTVYNYFGIAVRSAVANGYHRQRDTPHAKNDEARANQQINDEKFKRLWWTIFVIDTVWAAKMSMPVHIEYTDTDVDLPIENGCVDLHDDFSSEILEVNVHLVKYIAKYIKIIYGPNIRTFSINYINTDQFNQKLLVKNILQCLNDIVVNFEQPVLTPYKSYNIIVPHERNVGNLFLRYHQLIILITKPLLSLVFNANSVSLIENIEEVESAISKGLSAASSTIEIIIKFYQFNKLFVLGFWDSQHLFAALSILIMVMCAVGNDYDNEVKKQRQRDQIQRGVVLLSYMARNNNINAQNCMKKLKSVYEIAATIPQINLYCDLNADIDQYITKNTIKGSGGNEIGDEFFNPFISGGDDSSSDTGIETGGKLFQAFKMTKLSPQSRSGVCSLVNSIQSWDNFRGLPIHIYGTERSKMNTADKSN